VHGLTQIAQAAPDELPLVQALRREVAPHTRKITFEGLRLIRFVVALTAADGDPLRPAFALRARLLRGDVVGVEGVLANDLSRLAITSSAASSVLPLPLPGAGEDS
jgi:hypothetical protein